MRAFVFACVALVALSYGANYALQNIGFSTSERTSSPGIRLD